MRQLRPGYLIHDYISGKRQVSFPPVKMLFIVAIANVLASRLHDKLYGYPRHNLPEGFFLQVFMASLSLLIDTAAQLTAQWVNFLFPIFYIMAYRQLFGYGLWGTFWRLSLCVAIGFGLILFAFIAGAVWFNAETLFG